MILVTGATGFIGSAVVWQLNLENKEDILICDRFRDKDKWKNLQHLSFYDFVNPDELFEFIKKNHIKLTHIIHLGACSSTTETDMDFLYENNVRFSQDLWTLSIEHDAKFIYASSAATYGGGENGFHDDQNLISTLRPLNKYGYSKQVFDKWVLKQPKQPKLYAGLKFFNVFGPNEYHKGSMSSVVFHAFNQIKENGYVKLFKSHQKEYKDGEQKRDFVYIKDVTKMIRFFINETPPSGIYNVGSGEENSFKDFVIYAFKALKLKPKIKYIPMPKAIRDKYQYYTCASMHKIKSAGYKEDTYVFKDAVKDYVRHYLNTNDPYLK